MDKPFEPPDFPIRYSECVNFVLQAIFLPQSSLRDVPALFCPLIEIQFSVTSL